MSAFSTLPRLGAGLAQYAGTVQWDSSRGSAGAPFRQTAAPLRGSRKPQPSTTAASAPSAAGATLTPGTDSPAHAQ